MIKHIDIYVRVSSYNTFHEYVFKCNARNLLMCALERILLTSIRLHFRVWCTREHPVPTRKHHRSAPKQRLSQGELYARHTTYNMSRRESRRGKQLRTSALESTYTHSAASSILAFISSTLILKRVPSLVSTGNTR